MPPSHGRKSREDSENEANHRILEDHNIRGKYKGEGNRIESGISGLEGKLRLGTESACRAGISLYVVVRHARNSS